MTFADAARNFVRALILIPLLAPSVSAQIAVGSLDGNALGDGMGRSARFAGDLDGDTVPEIIVGAWSADSNGVDAGQVKVLSGKDLAPISTWNGAPGDLLGWSVDGTPDINGDGVPDLIIGARGNPASATQVSYARVLSGANGALIRHLPGLGSNGAAAMAVSGHVGNQVIVSTHDAVAGLARVRVYNAATGALLWNLAQPSPLHASFGKALRGGGAGSAGPFFVVGAELYPDDASFPDFRRGQIRVYSSVTGQLLWSANGDNALDHLGASVDVIGDLDGDGTSEIIAGAPASDTFFTSTPGTARIYSGATGAILHTLTGASPDDLFGIAVSGAGDFNGDGVHDFAIGAAAGGAQGGGYVRSLSGADASEISTINGLAAGDAFGTAVAATGMIGEGLADLLVGAPLADGPASNAGRVTLYQKPKYPGKGTGIRLLTGANAPPSRRDIHGVFGGEPATIRVDSPGGVFTGAYYVLLAQLFPTSAPYGPTPGLAGVQVNLNYPGTWIVLLEGALPAGGAEINLSVLSTLGGWSALFQAGVVSPLAPNGYATTHAHEYRHLDQANVYVSASTGSPGNSGLDSATPLSTLTAGYALSASLGDPANYVPYPDVIVATGTYAETPLFDKPINVSGGHDSTTWTHVPGSYSTVAVNNRGAWARNIQQAAVIKGLEFVAASGVNPSGPASLTMNTASVALDARGCSSALRFEDCIFQGGQGANGFNGAAGSANGSDGATGTSGSSGYYTLATNLSPNGGAGGAGAQGGGTGGKGGWMVCTNWLFGACITASAVSGGSGANGGACNNGGPGGNPSVCGTAGPGTPGAPGAPGTHGTNGAPSSLLGGYIWNGDWRPASASPGGFGGAGCGGGGGGGGGAVECAQQFAAGGSGGGGGGAGGGGSAGSGAADGGASFAVYLHNASPAFVGCSFVAGQGGTGGTGGNGKPGGNGSNGGNGGSGFNGTVFGVGLGSGAGGAGGVGGPGGGGGAGGGGHGGPSWCVFKAGSSNPPALTASGNAFSTGLGGTPGQGGTQGGSGAQGLAGQPGFAGTIGT